MSESGEELPPQRGSNRHTHPSPVLAFALRIVPAIALLMARHEDGATVAPNAYEAAIPRETTASPPAPEATERAREEGDEPADAISAPTDDREPEISHPTPDENSETLPDIWSLPEGRIPEGTRASVILPNGSAVIVNRQNGVLEIGGNPTQLSVNIPLLGWTDCSVTSVARREDMIVIQGKSPRGFYSKTSWDRESLAERCAQILRGETVAFTVPSFGMQLDATLRMASDPSEMNSASSPTEP